MPNHLHGIISTGGDPSTLGKVMAQFKSIASKRIKKLEAIDGPLWQRGYYDHIVRNEADLARIRAYVANNPLKWELDRENLDRIRESEEEGNWFSS
jgi:putative transposase